MSTTTAPTVMSAVATDESPSWPLSGATGGGVVGVGSAGAGGGVDGVGGAGAEGGVVGVRFADSGNAGGLEIAPPGATGGVTLKGGGGAWGGGASGTAGQVVSEMLSLSVPLGRSKFLSSVSAFETTSD